MTLYQLCIRRVAALMKRGYWSEANGSLANNPFSFLPSSVIDEITAAVVHLSSPGALKVTDLYYLLTSGRLEHFKLDDVVLSTEELVAILMSLSVACQNLKSLIFRNIDCSDPYSSSAKAFKEEKALECLLRISPRLESLKSCIPFDLKVIRNCEKLKVLKLNFVYANKPLYEFLKEDNSHFWPNESLKYLEVYEDVRNPVSYLDLVNILKYCTALTHINADISRSLEFMHSEELYDGSLNAKYKLQKCFLGSTLIDNGAVSLIAMHIATLTCPELRELDVLVNDNETIFALSDFDNLDSLLVQWELPDGGNFQLGVQLMLEKIGSKLKSLHILNFFHVDWAVIAATCPQLEILKLEYHNEFQSYERPTVCLQHLKSLHIELMELDFGCHEDTLIMLLSNCTGLSTLHIDGARNLNDRVLNQILVKNNLSNLREAVIFDSNLSEAGIRNLVSHLSSLDYFHFSSLQVDFEEAADIVHEINPHIILVADEGY